MYRIYAHLMERLAKAGSGNSGDTLWGHFQVFRQFIETAGEESAEIPIPKNLRSKKFQIPKTRREPNPFTREEFELILSHSNERLQAHLMLMLNCGMYQGDVAELVADEVDVQAGRIIRTRSKKKKIQAKIEGFADQAELVALGSNAGVVEKNWQQKGNGLPQRRWKFAGARCHWRRRQ